MHFMAFKSAINRAEEMVSHVKPFEYRYINNTISKIYDFIQKEKLKNPDMKDPDFYSLLYDYNSRLKTVSFCNEHILNQVTAYNACLYLLQNPKKYAEITEYVENNNISSDRDFFMHTNSFDENLTNLVLFMRHLYPQVASQVEDSYGPVFADILNSPKTNKEKHIMAEKLVGHLPALQRKHYLDAFELLADGIPAYMKTYLKYTETNIKKDLIESNTALVSLFDDMGYLDDWLTLANKQFEEIGLPELKQDKASLTSGLSEGVQKQLDTVDLLGINIMYTNRAFHILEDYSKAMYAISEFNLEPLILDGIEAPTLEDEDLKNILLKMELFYYPTEMYYTENENKIEEMSRSGELVLDDDENSERRYYSLEPLEKEMERSYGEEYKQYFSNVFPASKNSVGDDMLRFSQFANSIHRLKGSKAHIALSLYSFLELNDSQKRNYGVVVDKISEDGTSGELKHFTDFVVDINSILPVNVHVPSHIFSEFATEYFKSPIVPIYAGSNDWNMRNDRKMKSHVMVPWNKKSKKTIKQCSKNNKAYNQDTVAHLRFLSDENCPPAHLKQSPKDKQIHKTYINLDTGSILEKTKEGILVKVLPVGDDERDGR
ncbi:MAG TPA: hypothetical protein OIM48_06095 [Clostridiaceae bacterium]|jgi:hypothetical protein|nr:hypothetical protein [Clostridia bacterium]HJJ12851.1 hypothetical protein [Clostridiaceae bacterium]